MIKKCERAILCFCANPPRGRAVSSLCLRETWRAILSTDPKPTGGFIRGKNNILVPITHLESWLPCTWG